MPFMAPPFNFPPEQSFVPAMYPEAFYPPQGMFMPPNYGMDNIH